MKQVVLFAATLLISFMGTQHTFAGQSAHAPVLQDLINEALQNNPRMKVYEETILLSREKPAQARSLDNPRVRLGIMNLPTDTFRFDQEPMTQKQVSIMQKFPFPGKLELKGSLAQKEIDIAEEDYNEQKNALVREVKKAYINLLFLRRAEEITEENRSLLREFVGIAEKKYEVGRGIQQDVIKSQVELSKMTDRLIALQQKRKTAAARLNSLLNRPVQQPFVYTEKIVLTDFTMSFEELQKIAEENRPVLQRMNHIIEKSQISVKLSERNYYPDLDVGVSYGQRDDGSAQERADFLSGFITFSLPLWHNSKEGRKVAQEKANTRRTVEEYHAMKNDIDFQILHIMTEIEKSIEEIALLKGGLIPQSRLSLDSALSGYRVNKVDFLTLVNNQISLYNFELDYYRAIADHEIGLAELEGVVGTRLFNGSTGN